MDNARRVTDLAKAGTPTVGDIRPDGGAHGEASRPAIRITSLTKRFTRHGRGAGIVTPVDDVSIDIAEDDLVVLLGPSGCGKTTLLRCVAGLERPDSGEIEINGRIVFSSERGIFVPPEERGINMIFQSYALWPHMTVFDNVAFPLRQAKKGRLGSSAVRERVMQTLDLVGLAELTRSHPGQISGGQQQRVALARAIVGQDRVILFDEPLSNVDAKVREKLRVEILEIKRKLGFSALYVTHDQAEAMELADRIAVLGEGRVSQYDTPRRIYHRPATSAVGRFIGSANTFEGTLGTTTSGALPRAVKVESELGPMYATIEREDTLAAGRLTLLSRPEQWRITPQPLDENCWRGVIETLLFSGALTDYRVRVDDRVIQVVSSDSRLGEEGDQVWVSVPSEHLLGLPTEPVHQ